MDNGKCHTVYKPDYDSFYTVRHFSQTASKRANLNSQ